MRLLRSGVCTDCYAPSLITNGTQTYLSTGPTAFNTELLARPTFSESLFSSSLHTLTPKYFAEVDETIFEHLGRKLNIQIKEAIESKPSYIQSWYQSLILGEKSALDRSVVRAFKESGIFHLIAISGLHLVAFYWIISTIGTTFIAALSFTSCSSRLKIVLTLVVRIFGLVATLIYCFAVHFPPSVQRAFVLIAIDTLGKSAFGKIQLRKKISFGLTTQMALFPTGFLSIGNALSWIAYLIVVERDSKSQSLKEKLIQQLKLSVCCIFLTGQISIVGIFLNILLVPIFTFIFYLVICDVFFLIFGLDPFLDFVAKANQLFLGVLIKTNELTHHFNAILNVENQLHNLLKAVSLVFILIVLLRNPSFRSIHKSEGMG